MSTIGYMDALSAVEEAAGKGVGVYDMAVAFELDFAITLKKKAFKRRKKLIEKLEAEAPVIYDAAVDVFRKSAGGCSPSDAANSMLNNYLNCGMDIAKARKFAAITGFAIGS